MRSRILGISTLNLLYSLSCAFFACSLVLTACAATPTRWRAVLENRVAEFGHRNWICIVDSAYPKQSRASIETVVTGETQLAVVRAVLEELQGAEHVRAEVLVDLELASVDEADAPGIQHYRAELARLLAGRTLRREPHEQILHDLDAAGELVHVLVLKTDHALPYTSVFLRLDCGYWNADREARLRARLQAGPAGVR